MALPLTRMRSRDCVVGRSHRPSDWTLRVNMPMTPAEEEAVQRRFIRRGQPYGTELWQKRTASRLGLEPTFRPRGRPLKNPNNGT